MKASIDLDRALELYLRHQSVRGCTERWVRETGRNLENWFLRYLGEERDSAVRTTGRLCAALWDEFRLWLEDQEGMAGTRSAGVELSPAAQIKYLSCAKGFGKWLHQQKYMADEPYVAEYKFVQEPLTKDCYVPHEELEVLFKELSKDKSWEGVRDLALYKFLYASGARISEALKLNRGDLDKLGYMVKLTGKAGRERIVPYGRIAHRAIERYLLHTDGPRAKFTSPGRIPLFVSVRGNRMQAQTANKWLDRVSRAILGRQVRPHMLRHSCATAMLLGGADIAEIQKQLGHEHRRMTERYLVLLPEHEDKYQDSLTWN